MATDASDWNIANLRADLIGRAVADPEAFVDAVILIAEKHPVIRQPLIRHTIGSGPTIIKGAEPPAAPEPTPAQIAWVGKHLRVTPAGADVVYLRSLIHKGLAAPMGVKRGQDSVILGASVVSLAGVASFIDPAGDASQLDPLSEAIATQLGGQLTRRAATQKVNIRISPPRRQQVEQEAQEGDSMQQIVLMIQSGWEEAAAYVPEPQEDLQGFAKRLVQACRKSAPSSSQAQEALTMAESRYPQISTW